MSKTWLVQQDEKFFCCVLERENFYIEIVRGKFGDFVRKKLVCKKGGNMVCFV